MTTPAPAKTPKQKRHDAYIARVTITIPLATDKPDSYANAVKAVAGIEKTLPEGCTVKIEASLGKV